MPEPITSLLRKSEKAQKKLAPGTWQHTMLGDNIRALRLASALMHDDTHGPGALAVDDLAQARRSLASLVSRTEQALARFSPGTPQHTLQANRLAALRLAVSAVMAAGSHA